MFLRIERIADDATAAAFWRGHLPSRPRFARYLYSKCGQEFGHGAKHLDEIGARVHKKSPDAFQCIRAFLASGLRYKALRQPIDCIALTVADDVTVDPEGYTDIAMAELIPDRGDRGSALDQFRRDRVPESVKPDTAHCCSNVKMSP
jgi:hypothetical protein